MRLILVPLCAASLTFASPLRAQENGETYHARLVLAGYLLRSGAVCKGPDAKRAIDTAVRYATSGELRQFNQAYPKTSEDWMRQGAGRFNDGVMKDGLRATCAEAMQTAREAP